MLAAEEPEGRRSLLLPPLPYLLAALVLLEHQVDSMYLLNVAAVVADQGREAVVLAKKVNLVVLVEVEAINQSMYLQAVQLMLDLL